MEKCGKMYTSLTGGGCNVFTLVVCDRMLVGEHKSGHNLKLFWEVACMYAYVLDVPSVY